MSEPPCRHVWVSMSDGARHPGLVVVWRRADQGWEAYVAVAQDGAVLASWYPAVELLPVSDSRASM